MIIGITGSSGAGKSTVCEILKNEYHVKVINADKIAKELSKKGTLYLLEIVEKFGEEILLENGELNRKKLANIIYHNEEKRNQLNECTFKYIRKEIETQIQEHKEELIAIDVPLLFEANLQNICNTTIAVVAKNKEAQIARIMERDNIDKIHAQARLSAQHQNEFYTSRCEFVITNDNEIADIEKQIEEILNVIKSK